MLGKLTHLLRNKIAVAIFGAVLVASAGSAAALAASGNSIQMPFASHGSTSQHHSDDGSNNDHGNAQNGQGDDDKDGHEAEGTISSIDAGNSSFVVKTEHGSSITVVVNSATVFSDGPHSFADLKAGMSIEVDGSFQSDGTLTATRVHGAGEGASDDLNDDHGGDTSGSGGVGSNSGADDHGGHDSALHN